MIEVSNPRVFLIAQPVVVGDQMVAYLREIGGESWFQRVFGDEPPPAAESLIEFCGRLCYRSWEPGLNRNVTKVREDRGEYLLNILRCGHGSVTEHAVFSFVIHDCSRVLTAELNRHRAGVAISEQSLRYVRLSELRFWMPPGLPDEVAQAGRELVEEMERFQQWAAEYCGLDNEGDEADLKLSFHDKKTITSRLRRFAPLGLATEEAWSANVRTIRHVIEMRSAEGAEEEIRIFAHQLYEIMSQCCPLLFGDYYETDGGALTTDYRKV